METQPDVGLRTDELLVHFSHHAAAVETSGGLVTQNTFMFANPQMPPHGVLEKQRRQQKRQHVWDVARSPQV